MKMTPLQHVDGGVGQLEHALQQAAAGADAAEEQRDRDDPSGLPRAMNATSTPV